MSLRTLQLRGSSSSAVRYSAQSRNKPFPVWMLGVCACGESYVQYLLDWFNMSSSRTNTFLWSKYFTTATVRNSIVFSRHHAMAVVCMCENWHGSASLPNICGGRMPRTHVCNALEIVYFFSSLFLLTKRSLAETNARQTTNDHKMRRAALDTKQMRRDLCVRPRQQWQQQQHRRRQWRRWVPRSRSLSNKQ